jgi:hypothetical protein
MKFFSFVLLVLVISYASLNTKEISRKIASGDDPALVNALIENRDAMKARKDVWMNPNARRIFLSTFEFEEDTIGMSQVKFAIEQAQKGKTVDIVLDAAGHKLSDETILHMIENGVNVHVFSPMFSWKGFKSRHGRLRKTWRGNIPMITSSTAAWRQTSYRMHDKILINFDPTQDIGGQVILGGRNARDSHYGIDQRVMKGTRKEGFGKEKTFAVANPAFEYEHEVLIHNKGLHEEVATYVDDFLESSDTERVDAKTLRLKMKKSRAHAKKNGDSWKTKLAADKVSFDDDFRAFTRDMKQWNNSYIRAVESGSENQDFLAKKIINIFTHHQSSLTRLIDEKLINPKVIDRILKPLYGKVASQIVRTSDYQKAPAADIAEQLKLLLSEQPEVIAKNIKVRALKVETLDKLLGPMAPDNAGILTKSGRGLKNSFLGTGFNFEKLDNIDKILNQAIVNYNEFGNHKNINWVAQATEVDSVQFLHDTIDDNTFRKKSMDELYDMISNCRKECVWNSQYGSLTPEAQNAIENVIKKNSSIYRFVQSELRAPGGKNAAKQKANKIIALFKSNTSYMANKLHNDIIPVKEVKLDIDDIAKTVKKLLQSSPDASSQIKKAVALVKKDLTDKKAFKTYTRTLAKIIKENQVLLVEEIVDNGDNVERSLLKMRGFVDMDPTGALPPHEMIQFHFMTNDVDSWAVGADKVIHSDFHKNMMTKFRKMGPGLHVYGLNTGGRIHSKVAITEFGLVVSSMNADPRSEKFNTEVGVKIVTRYKGMELTEKFKQHIYSYMLSQRKYIDGSTGKMVRPKQCFDIMTTIARRIMAPIL